ncbi:MAG: hypothetical protein ACEQR8_06420, partial [Cypionkella sp.]
MRRLGLDRVLADDMRRFFFRIGMLALAALVLALTATVTRKEPESTVPSSAISDYFAARAQDYCWGNCPSTAQRVCFSGDCPCFDEPYRTQCFADRKASFQRDNPPRGELVGVCWAFQGKWERDPAGKEVFRTRSPIYSKVRFNERQTLSKWARDDRDAGFETEVGGAWHQFVQANYAADFPNADGWSWSTKCVSTDRPRKTEDQEWAKAQQQATYQRVFMPTFGIADTPEERALEAKLAKERAAKAAEEKRIADAKAAEAARINAAAEAKRRAEVAAMEAALGPGKRAAAERLLAMNAEVAKYRPKQPLAIAPKPGATPSPAPSPPRQCTRRQGTQPVSHTAAAREAAEAGIARARGTPGGSETIVQSSVGAPPGPP